MIKTHSCLYRRDGDKYIHERWRAYESIGMHKIASGTTNLDPLTDLVTWLEYYSAMSFTHKKSLIINAR